MTTVVLVRRVKPAVGFTLPWAGVTPAPSDFSRSAVARGDPDWSGECEKGRAARLPLALRGRGSKVRVLIQRAILFARDLRFCRLGWLVIGNSRGIRLLPRARPVPPVESVRPARPAPVRQRRELRAKERRPRRSLQKFLLCRSSLLPDQTRCKFVVRNFESRMNAVRDS
jgi:hypothetical protein